MKSIKFYLWSLFLVLMSVSFVACSDDNDDDPDPGPGPEVPEEVESHFDIWVSIGSTSGMGSTNTQLVKNVESLEDQAQIDFLNSGADVTSYLYQESIIKGKYYYQVPKSADRIGKYQIINDKITIIRERAFSNLTLKDRRYTHAWIDDNTLVLMGSNGDSDKILWIKLNTETMTILGEGEMEGLTLPDGEKYSTSGIAGYREADGKILYSYTVSTARNRNKIWMAFINPGNMSTEKVVEEDRVDFMAGTAYGELLQSKSFFTPNGDYYLACSNYLPDYTSTTQNYGRLLRIKAGTTGFDQTYEGFNYDTGKIVTAECISATKALLYIQDPEYTGAAGWGDDYNCYYVILDLETDAVKEIEYNGSKLPYSSGTFSQRSAVLDGKVYIGVNPEAGQPTIYIYDIETGNVTKGLTITSGYEFDRIVPVLD